MKKLTIFLLLLFFVATAMTQVNPYGLDLSPEGKIVFSFFEPHDPDDFETFNYTYDESGITNSKSILLPDYNWYTCTFHRK